MCYISFRADKIFSFGYLKPQECARKLALNVSERDDGNRLRAKGLRGNETLIISREPVVNYGAGGPLPPRCTDKLFTRICATRLPAPHPCGRPAADKGEKTSSVKKKEEERVNEEKENVNARIKNPRTNRPNTGVFISHQCLIRYHLSSAYEEHSAIESRDVGRLVVVVAIRICRKRPLNYY